MYGGKFMPFHKGHNYCLETASKQCDVVYAILFAGGDQEEEIVEQLDYEWLTVESRWNKLKELAKTYPNVIPCLIDVSECKYPDGSEDWDAETPLVREVCGPYLSYVYGSEPHYKDYFDRAYPEAEYILVDVKREKYPISGTMIREMTDEKEQEKWKM